MQETSAHRRPERDTYPVSEADNLFYPHIMHIAHIMLESDWEPMRYSASKEFKKALGLFRIQTAETARQAGQPYTKTTLEEGMKIAGETELFQKLPGGSVKLEKLAELLRDQFCIELGIPLTSPRER